MERFTQPLLPWRDLLEAVFINGRAIDGERTEGVQCRSDRVVNGCTLAVWDPVSPFMLLATKVQVEHALVLPQVEVLVPVRGVCVKACV